MRHPMKPIRRPPDGTPLRYGARSNLRRRNVRQRDTRATHATPHDPRGWLTRAAMQPRHDEKQPWPIPVQALRHRAAQPMMGDGTRAVRPSFESNEGAYVGDAPRLVRRIASAGAPCATTREPSRHRGVVGHDRVKTTVGNVGHHAPFGVSREFTRHGRLDRRSCNGRSHT